MSHDEVRLRWIFSLVRTSSLVIWNVSTIILACIMPMVIMRQIVYKVYISFLNCFRLWLLELIINWDFHQTQIPRLLYVPFYAFQVREESITRMLTVIISIFIICQTPGLITMILQALPFIPLDCGTPAFYMITFNNALVFANSNINVFVYVNFNQKFRQILYRKVSCLLPACCSQETNQISRDVENVVSSMTAL